MFTKCFAFWTSPCVQEVGAGRAGGRAKGAAKIKQLELPYHAYCPHEEAVNALRLFRTCRRAHLQPHPVCAYRPLATSNPTRGLSSLQGPRHVQQHCPHLLHGGRKPSGILFELSDACVQLLQPRRLLRGRIPCGEICLPVQYLLDPREDTEPYKEIEHSRGHICHCQHPGVCLL